MRLKRDTRKRLGEEIGGVYDSRSVIYNEKLGFDMRMDEMITNVYVFSFAMIGVVDRERLGTIVISADDER